MKNCFYLTSNGNILVTGSKNFFMTPKSEFVRHAGDGETVFLSQVCPKVFPQKGKTIELPKELPLWKFLWSNYMIDDSGEYNRTERNFYFARKRNSKVEFLKLQKFFVDSGFPQDSLGQYQGSGTAQINFLDVEFSERDFSYFEEENIEKPDIFRVWSRGNKINHGDTCSIEKYGKLCSAEESVWDTPDLAGGVIEARIHHVNFVTGSTFKLEDVKNLKFEEPKSRRRDSKS